MYKPQIMIFMIYLAFLTELVLATLQPIGCFLTTKTKQEEPS